MEIRRLKIFPFGIFLAVIGSLLGLLCGVIYGIGGFFVDLAVSLQWLSPEQMETPGLSWGTVLALGALVGMPLIGLAAGFIAGMIGAMLYNLVMGKTGGVSADFWEG